MGRTAISYDYGREGKSLRIKAKNHDHKKGLKATKNHNSINYGPKALPAGSRETKRKRNKTKTKGPKAASEKRPDKQQGSRGAKQAPGRSPLERTPPHTTQAKRPPLLPQPPLPPPPQTPPGSPWLLWRQPHPPERLQNPAERRERLKTLPAQSRRAKHHQRQQEGPAAKKLANKKNNRKGILTRARRSVSCNASKEARKDESSPRMAARSAAAALTVWKLAAARASCPLGGASSQARRTASFPIRAAARQILPRRASRRKSEIGPDSSPCRRRSLWPCPAREEGS